MFNLLRHHKKLQNFDTVLDNLDINALYLNVAAEQRVEILTKHLEELNVDTKKIQRDNATFVVRECISVLL